MSSLSSVALSLKVGFCKIICIFPIARSVQKSGLDDLGNYWSSILTPRSFESLRSLGLLLNSIIPWPFLYILFIKSQLMHRFCIYYHTIRVHIQDVRLRNGDFLFIFLRLFAVYLFQCLLFGQIATSVRHGKLMTPGRESNP